MPSVFGSGPHGARFFFGVFFLGEEAFLSLAGGFESPLLTAGLVGAFKDAFSGCVACPCCRIAAQAAAAAAVEGGFSSSPKIKSPNMFKLCFPGGGEVMVNASVLLFSFIGKMLMADDDFEF